MRTAVDQSLGGVEADGGVEEENWPRVGEVEGTDSTDSTVGENENGLVHVPWDDEKGLDEEIVEEADQDGREKRRKATQTIRFPAVKVTRRLATGGLGGGGSRETIVDVDEVEVPRGLLTAVMGPSGAGKTTWISSVVSQLLANKNGCNSRNLRIGYICRLR